MIARSLTVAVAKDGVQIARVLESGAVFGELSILLDRPHTADVRTVEASQFHIADEALFAKDPLAFINIVSTTPIGR
jgi:CRP/FNR family transcriptional regulator, cyclic AMP receptor protein